MILVAMYEDGSVYSSVDTAWRNFPRDKKITSLSVYDIEGNVYELVGCDAYWFSDEATCILGNTNSFKWESRSIAGFDFDINAGTTYTVFMDGRETYINNDVKFSDYIKKYKEECFIYANI